jgi:hypothetical protein
MMRDKHIIQTARQLGWNTEHELTNQMLVRLVRQVLSDVQGQLREEAEHIQDKDPEGANAVRDCISLFDSWGE